MIGTILIHKYVCLILCVKNIQRGTLKYGLTQVHSRGGAEGAQVLPR
jgi:hypothetical protein